MSNNPGCGESLPLDALCACLQVYCALFVALAEKFLQARQASDKRCTALQERCDALQERCTSLSDRCDALGTQREEMVLTISNAENDAAVALKLLEDEKSRYSNAQVSLAELQEALSKKDEILTQRGKQVDELTAQISDLNEQAKEMEEQLMEQDALFKKGLASAQSVLEEAQAERSELVEAHRLIEAKLEQSLETQQSEGDALKDSLQRYEDLSSDHSALILEHETVRLEGEKAKEELLQQMAELAEQLKNKQKEVEDLEEGSKASKEEFAQRVDDLEMKIQDQLKKFDAERSTMLEETERIKGLAQERDKTVPKLAESQKPLGLDTKQAASAPKATAPASAPLKQGSSSPTKNGQVMTQSRPLSGSAGVKVAPQSPSAQAARTAAQASSSSSSSSSSSAAKPAQRTTAQHMPPPMSLQHMPAQPYGGMAYMHQYQGGNMKR
jgi:chromosome segregation ATPase